MPESLDLTQSSARVIIGGYQFRYDIQAQGQENSAMLFGEGPGH